MSITKIRPTLLASVPLKAALPLMIAIGLTWCCTASAEDATCKVVFDAMLKSATTPNHQFAVRKMVALNGGRPVDSELITVDNVIYLKSDGKWQLSPISPLAMRDQMIENRKDAKATCHFLGDETVDGVSASLYQVHEDNPDSGPTDSKVWIGKSNGLPVHSILDVSDMHSVVRYSYDDVVAPAIN